MPPRILPWMLTCAPIVIMLGAWGGVIYRWQHVKSVRPIGFTVLSLATANAILAAGTFLYYEFHPHGFLPPWEDPEIGNEGLLFFLAPVAMILGFVAAVRGTPKWLVGLIEVASVPLVLVGFAAVQAF
jgi:hypothetical protein